MALIGDHGMLADPFTREIYKLEATANLDGEDARELHRTHEKLLEQQAELEAMMITHNLDV